MVVISGFVALVKKFGIHADLSLRCFFLKKRPSELKMVVSLPFVVGSLTSALQNKVSGKNTFTSGLFLSRSPNHEGSSLSLLCSLAKLLS